MSEWLGMLGSEQNQHVSLWDEHGMAAQKPCMAGADKAKGGVDTPGPCAPCRGGLTGSARAAAGARLRPEPHLEPQRRLRLGPHGAAVPRRPDARHRRPQLPARQEHTLLTPAGAGSPAGPHCCTAQPVGAACAGGLRVGLLPPSLTALVPSCCCVRIHCLSACDLCLCMSAAFVRKAF